MTKFSDNVAVIIIIKIECYTSRFARVVVCHGDSSIFNANYIATIVDCAALSEPIGNMTRASCGNNYINNNNYSNNYKKWKTKRNKE